MALMVANHSLFKSQLQGLIRIRIALAVVSVDKNSSVVTQTITHNIVPYIIQHMDSTHDKHINGGKENRMVMCNCELVFFCASDKVLCCR